MSNGTPVFDSDIVSQSPTITTFQTRDIESQLRAQDDDDGRGECAQSLTA